MGNHIGKILFRLPSLGDSYVTRLVNPSLAASQSGMTMPGNFAGPVAAATRQLHAKQGNDGTPG